MEDCEWSIVGDDVEVLGIYFYVGDDVLANCEYFNALEMFVHDDYLAISGAEVEIVIVAVEGYDVGSLELVGGE